MCKLDFVTDEVRPSLKVSLKILRFAWPKSLWIN